METLRKTQYFGTLGSTSFDQKGRDGVIYEVKPVVKRTDIGSSVMMHSRGMVLVTKELPASLSELVRAFQRRIQ